MKTLIFAFIPDLFRFFCKITLKIFSSKKIIATLGETISFHDLTVTNYSRAGDISVNKSENTKELIFSPSNSTVAISSKSVPDTEMVIRANYKYQVDTATGCHVFQVKKVNLQKSTISLSLIK